MPAPIWPAPTTPNRAGSRRAMPMCCRQGEGLWRRQHRTGVGGGRRRRPAGFNLCSSACGRALVASASSDRRWMQHLAGRLLHSRVLGRLHTGCKRVGGCDGKFAGCREGDRQTACPPGRLSPLALTGQPVNETPAVAHPCVNSPSTVPRTSAHCAAASCRRVNSATWLRRSKVPCCPARTSPPSCAPWVSGITTACERGALHQVAACRRRRRRRQPPNGPLAQAPSCGPPMSICAGLVRRCRRRSRQRLRPCCCRRRQLSLQQ